MIHPHFHSLAITARCNVVFSLVVELFLFFRLWKHYESIRYERKQKKRGASVSQTPAAKLDHFRETLINPNMCKLFLIFK